MALTRRSSASSQARVLLCNAVISVINGKICLINLSLLSTITFRVASNVIRFCLRSSSAITHGCLGICAVFGGAKTIGDAILGRLSDGSGEEGEDLIFFN